MLMSICMESRGWHEDCGVYGLFLGFLLLGRLFIAFAFVYLCLGAFHCLILSVVLFSY